jgi:hypothetical protein
MVGYAYFLALYEGSHALFNAIPNSFREREEEKEIQDQTFYNYK